MKVTSIATATAPRIPTIPPTKLAHFVLRTSRFDQIVSWYKMVFGARSVFESGQIAFLAYDDEHHRIAFLNVPGLAEQSEGVVGVHHIAFTYETLGVLMSQYERLRDTGVKPVYVINHGPTTSLYYADPDGNQLEFQVENFDTVEESTKFFFTEDFAENPIGVEFDPEELVARLRAGEDEASLKTRARIGQRGLADVKLR
jgi:catechol 2,3-dioxygenase-like lactoylglutathione lyase family enzyme